MTIVLVAKKFCGVCFLIAFVLYWRMWKSQEEKSMDKKEWFHIFDTDYTQVEIADLMGVKQPQVSNWLNGKRIPTSSNLVKLANILVMRPEHLLEKIEAIKQENQA
jgi:hypothetical protein